MTDGGWIYLESFGRGFCRRIFFSGLKTYDWLTCIITGAFFL
jgi:hypothetical protein